MNTTIDFEINNVFIEENEEDEIKPRVSLFEFAFCGTSDVYNDRLRKLAGIAEKEVWTYGELENNILYYYIIDTFSRCMETNKIIYSKDEQYAAFNTGLLTKNGLDILGMFNKNKYPEAPQPWFFLGFFAQNSWEYLQKFNEVPELAIYTDNYEDFYFNTQAPITYNIDHILDDNWERIKAALGNRYDKAVVKTLFTGAISIAFKKIQRNMSLVIPQYFKRQIMYLIPISFPIEDNKEVTMALAAQKLPNNQYRANTILTLDMAYSRARLLMKLERNWLDQHIEFSKKKI